MRRPGMQCRSRLRCMGRFRLRRGSLPLFPGRRTPRNCFCGFRQLGVFRRGGF